MACRSLQKRRKSKTHFAVLVLVSVAGSCQNHFPCAWMVLHIFEGSMLDGRLQAESVKVNGAVIVFTIQIPAQPAVPVKLECAHSRGSKTGAFQATVPCVFMPNILRSAVRLHAYS
jgi:hypothetical protein